MIVNLLDVERGEQLDRDGFRFFGRPVGRSLGAERLGCGLYDLPPGEQLWPYHWHDGRELRPGDVVAFPEGEEGAHTFLNHSGEDARVAIFSARNTGSSAYPDSGKVSAVGLLFRTADAVDYWEGEGRG
ncbi:MAG: hypothetical protein ACRDLM_07140 [Gaiellaceae bacterium]